MVRLLSMAAAAALAIGVSAQAQPSCSAGNLCPASSPCCSTYGQCGVGAYCLGGCDPRYSHSIKACVPAPVCKSGNFALNSLSDVSDLGSYLGDASKTNWVSSGKPVVYNNEALLLTMGTGTVGTLLSSTHYVWYGKITATITTSKGAGVVTAFILMSDTKDEIDYEWVGVDTNNAQTNYYAQGITNYNNGGNVSAPNTDTVTHTYTVDWTPDKIDWSVDGKVLRTKNKADTWNSTGNRFDFPQTPSRVQMSLWPAGLASNGKGTVDWSGGLVDWNSPNMKNGYYFAMFKDVKIECYNPPSGADIKGSKSYIYKDTKSTNSSIQIVDDVTILKSLFATGENPGTDPNPSSTDKPQTVPGVSGIGTRGDVPGGSSNAASGSGSGSGSGFSQGTTNSQGAPGVRQSGSAFAVLVTIVFVCLWI